MRELSWLGAVVAIGSVAVGCNTDPVVTPDAFLTADGGRDAGPVVTPDGGHDAHVDIDGGNDAAVVDDAGHDAATSPDTGVDGGPPPLGDGMPHVLSLSAAGHDRFYAATFDGAGHLYAVGNISDGIETTTDFATIVARFGSSGALDTSWATNGVFRINLTVGTVAELPRGVVTQSDGRIVVSTAVEHPGLNDAGCAAPCSRDRDVALFRLNTDGTLDTTFGTNGIVIHDTSTGRMSGTAYLVDAAWGLGVDASDRLVLHGSMVPSDTSRTDTDFAVLRFLADGAIDTSFGTNGLFTLDVASQNGNARNLTMLPDGRILCAGYWETTGSTPVVYRLTTAGALDTTWGTGGVFSAPVLAGSTETYAARLQGDRVVTTGYGRNDTTGGNAALDWVSLRLSAAGVLDTTYGGHGAGYAQVDLAAQQDNSRNLLVLPDDRVLLVGGMRPTASNTDGAVAILTEGGVLDTTFDTDGIRTVDLGGTADFLWGVALAPTHDRVAIVGISAMTATSPATTDDDAVVWILPL